MRLNQAESTYNRNCVVCEVRSEDEEIVEHRAHNTLQNSTTFAALRQMPSTLRNDGDNITYSGALRLTI